MTMPAVKLRIETHPTYCEVIVSRLNDDSALRQRTPPSGVATVVDHLLGIAERSPTSIYPTTTKE